MTVVKKLEWNEYNDEQGIPDRWDAEASSFGVFYSIEIQHDGYRAVFDHEAVGAVGLFDTLEAAKAAAQADYEARILSALEPSAARKELMKQIREGTARGFLNDGSQPEGNPDLDCPYCCGSGHKGDVHPSAARELALEEAAKIADNGNAGWLKKRDVTANKKEARDYETMAIACSHVASAIRALSSPDHADAGKVEGDGIERAKFYHHQWPMERLLAARRDGLVDHSGGEAWRYEYSHKDEHGKYDILYRPVKNTTIPARLPSAPSEGAE